MYLYIERKRTRFPFQFISAILVIAFTLSLITPPVYAQTLPGNSSLNLPNPGAMVPVSPAFQPAVIAGLQINPDNPLRFNFIIDKGDSGLDGLALKDESEKLIKYFLAAMTVPADDLWVNLSPYEGDRIIPEKFGYTEMGKDLLAQDYLLKQLSATLMYPEDELGANFWEKVYARAQKIYGTTSVPVNTFNKVWIVPEKARIYAEGDTAMIVESHLKVMLEGDYLALLENLENEERGTNRLEGKDVEKLSDVSSEIMRNTIIPAIEQEINQGQNFAPLRQIYNSMILATWYKKNLKESLLSKVYAEQNKITGVDLDDKTLKDQIYQQYLEAFEVGVFNYIREDTDTFKNKKLPRKYFSGGFEGGPINDVFRADARIGDLERSYSIRGIDISNLDLSGESESNFVSVDAALDPLQRDGINQLFQSIAERERLGRLTENDLRTLQSLSNSNRAFMNQHGADYLGILVRSQTSNVSQIANLSAELYRREIQKGVEVMQASAFDFSAETGWLRLPLDQRAMSQKIKNIGSNIMANTPGRDSRRIIGEVDLEDLFPLFSFYSLVDAVVSDDPNLLYGQASMLFDSSKYIEIESRGHRFDISEGRTMVDQVFGPNGVTPNEEHYRIFREHLNRIQNETVSDSLGINQESIEIPYSPTRIKIADDVFLTLTIADNDPNVLVIEDSDQQTVRIGPGTEIGSAYNIGRYHSNPFGITSDSPDTVSRNHILIVWDDENRTIAFDETSRVGTIIRTEIQEAVSDIDSRNDLMLQFLLTQPEIRSQEGVLRFLPTVGLIVGYSPQRSAGARDLDTVPIRMESDGRITPMVSSNEVELNIARAISTHNARILGGADLASEADEAFLRRKLTKTRIDAALSGVLDLQLEADEIAILNIVQAMTTDDPSVLERNVEDLDRTLLYPQALDSAEDFDFDRARQMVDAYYGPTSPQADETRLGFYRNIIQIVEGMPARDVIELNRGDKIAVSASQLPGFKLSSDKVLATRKTEGDPNILELADPQENRQVLGPAAGPFSVVIGSDQDNPFGINRDETPNISGRHIRVDNIGGRITIVDSSRNGTGVIVKVEEDLNKILQQNTAQLGQNMIGVVQYADRTKSTYIRSSAVNGSILNLTQTPTENEFNQSDVVRLQDDGTIALVGTSLEDVHPLLRRTIERLNADQNFIDLVKLKPQDLSSEADRVYDVVRFEETPGDGGRRALDPASSFVSHRDPDAFVASLREKSAKVREPLSFKSFEDRGSRSKMLDLNFTYHRDEGEQIVPVIVEPGGIKDRSEGGRFGDILRGTWQETQGQTRFVVVVDNSEELAYLKDGGTLRANDTFERSQFSWEIVASRVFDFTEGTDLSSEVNLDLAKKEFGRYLASFLSNSAPVIFSTEEIPILRKNLDRTTPGFSFTQAFDAAYDQFRRAVLERQESLGRDMTVAEIQEFAAAFKIQAPLIPPTTVSLDLSSESQRRAPVSSAGQTWQARAVEQLSVSHSQEPALQAGAVKANITSILEEMVGLGEARQELPQLLDFPQIGEELRTQWRTQGYEAQYGNLNQYMALLMTEFTMDAKQFEVIKDRVDLIIRPAGGNVADPQRREDLRMALWAQGVALATHVRYFGPHSEMINDGPRSGTLDLLDTDYLIKVVREFIPTLIVSKDDPAFNAPLRVSPGFKGPGILQFKGRDVTQRDVMLWGLVTMLDPMIHNYLSYGLFVTSEQSKLKDARDYIRGQYGSTARMLDKISRDMLLNLSYLDETGKQVKVKSEDIDQLLSEAFELFLGDDIGVFQSPFVAYVADESINKVLKENEGLRGKVIPLVDQTFAFALNESALRRLYTPGTEQKFIPSVGSAVPTGVQNYMLFLNQPWVKRFPQLAQTITENVDGVETTRRSYQVRIRAQHSSEKDLSSEREIQLAMIDNIVAPALRELAEDHDYVTGSRSLDQLMQDYLYHLEYEGDRPFGDQALDSISSILEKGMDPFTMVGSTGSVNTRISPADLDDVRRVYDRIRDDPIFRDLSAESRSFPTTPERVGGIDINPALLELQEEGQGLQFEVPFEPKIFNDMPVDGFAPVIFQILPIHNLPQIIGRSGESPQGPLARLHPIK